MPELAVDGVVGAADETAAVCPDLPSALPVSRADMAPGSAEERLLMSATALPAYVDAPSLGR